MMGKWWLLDFGLKEMWITVHFKELVKEGRLIWLDYGDQEWEILISGRKCKNGSELKVRLYKKKHIKLHNTALDYNKQPAKQYRNNDIDKFELQLTDDEKDLHQDVADARRVSSRRAAVLPYLYGSEANVVGNGDGYVEGGQQDQPIPAGLERTVVQEDQTGLLDISHLILRDGVSIGSKNTLQKYSKR